MSTRHRILTCLVDGKFHSGTELGKHLGISRAAINKSVQGLIERGVDIHSVSGKGYRWDCPHVLLNQKKIMSEIGSMASEHKLSLTLVDEIESTSSYLLDSIDQPYVGAEICLTESQTGGRGRRGRNWLASPYQNIVFSISWQFEYGPSQTSGLSIAAGIAIVRVLSRLGYEGIKLKWPNDIIHEGRKLAGLLVDLRGESEGPTRVILGVGLNVRLNKNTADQLDQPWTDLESIGGIVVDRNKIVAEIVRELVSMFSEFGRFGLAPYHKEWSKWHAYEKMPVRLIQLDGEINGTVCGIDGTGALKLDTGTEIITVHSGEVSLRAI